jgi:hypothetical protein
MRIRWMLPVTQLVLSGILLWPLRYGYYLQIRNALHARWPTMVEGRRLYFNVAAPGDATKDSALSYAHLHLDVPALLNIPVVLIGLARRETVPYAFLGECWRALTWPVAGIVFWWIAGRGIEALVASRSRLISPSLNWVEAITGLLVSAGMGALLIGLAVDPSVRSESIYPWRLEVPAGLLWFVLGIVLVVARLVQWQIRRRPRLEARPQSAQI